MDKKQVFSLWYLMLAGVATALLWGSSPVRAQEPGGREIIDRVERLLWGSTVQGEYEMSITTPRWQRTLVLRVWMERPRRSFVASCLLPRKPVSDPYASAARCGTTCRAWSA